MTDGSCDNFDPEPNRLFQSLSNFDLNVAIQKISRRELVKASTYREYERRIEEYMRRRKRPKRSL
jgi:hypothetical protein